MSLKKYQQKHKKYKYKQYDWQLEDLITAQDQSDDQAFDLEEDHFDLLKKSLKYASCYACCQVYPSTRLKKKHIDLDGDMVSCPFCKKNCVIRALIPKDKLLKINHFLLKHSLFHSVVKP
jgi:NAD-dependent SIR2 family protein deacetylase